MDSHGWWKLNEKLVMHLNYEMHNFTKDPSKSTDMTAAITSLKLEAKMKGLRKDH